MNPIITLKEAQQILQKKEGVLKISLDLGISQTEIEIKEGIVNIQNEKIPLKNFEKVKEKTCYTLIDNTLQPIALFSQESNFYYKLIPTEDWPTFTISSTPMHRHTRISPKVHAQLQVKEIFPVKGCVLDTCCGLGYTAILAAKYAEKVYTFEIDPYVVELAKCNPYSQELFNNKKILLEQKDSCESIVNFKNNFFDRIIHDPPTFTYAPQLYEKKFHAELYRVLKKDGILYHYCPTPQKTKGNLLYPRIIRQLREVGFQNVVYHEHSSGIWARK
ncbi:methyltransferase domain-containing protein [Candidatus Woesearchaeota archaeon]|nr:methyltransferase domain-containing protein [Candidatus Woesearchaeota archaeon]